MKGIAYIGEKNSFVPLEKAAISIMDMGLQRGLGVFETFMTYEGKPFGMNEHIDRLFASLQPLDIRIPYTRELLVSIIEEGVRKMRLKSKRREVMVKLMATAGDSHTLIKDGQPRFFAVFLPLVPFPREQYENGISIKTVELPRVLPEIKSFNYLAGYVAHQKARKEGFTEAVHIDGKKQILEGTTFNIALVNGKTIIVPEDGVLPGITISMVIGIAKKIGFAIVRRPIKYVDLKNADEVFITSSNREIISVVKIDALKIGTGAPGLIARKLLQLYQERAYSS